MNIEDKAVPLGSWGNSELVQTANENSGLGVDADLPDDVRFFAGVAKLVRRRLQEVSYNHSFGTAIFLLKPNAPVGISHEAKRIPMLDNGLTEVAGRIWFVNSVVVTGHYVDVSDYDDDRLFRKVTDDLDLGQVPAVVFVPRTKIPEVRFYQKGLGSPESYLSAKLNGADVSLERIFEEIDRVHGNSLVTPDANSSAGRLWRDKTKFWPAEDAEELVQLYLKVGLASAFPTCTVRQEQTGVPGRLDLEIEERDPTDPTRITRHAILELKVLRSFGSTGKKYADQTILEWVDSGVRQAAAYCKDRGALASALCCFDMRSEPTGQSCFDHVKELASKWKVALRLWVIYAASEQYRSAIITL